MKFLTVLPKFLFAVVLTSCGPDPSTGGQTGEETVGCLPVEKKGLERAEVSDLGFSADEVITKFIGSQTHTMTWHDETTSELTITTEERGSYEWVDNEWIDDREIQPALAPAEPFDCPDTVEFTIAATVTTADGRLSETFETTLQASTLDRVAFAYRVSAADVDGAFDFSEFGPDEKIAASLTISLSDASGDFSGVISQEPVGKTVSASNETFGSWAPADTLE